MDSFPVNVLRAVAALALFVFGGLFGGHAVAFGLIAKTGGGTTVVYAMNTAQWGPAGSITAGSQAALCTQGGQAVVAAYVSGNSDTHRTYSTPGFTMSPTCKGVVNKFYDGGNAGSDAWDLAITSSSTTETPSCPTNSTDTAGQSPPCVCNLGFQADGSACKATSPEACKTVADQLSGGSLTYAGKGSTSCVSGCTVYSAVRGYLSSTNTTTAEGPFASQGLCAGAAATGTDAGTAARAPAPVGKCWGQVNGADVLVDCSNTAVPDKGTTTTNPDGSTSATKTSTDCTDALCTTTKTTTTTNAAGTVTGTTTATTTESPKSFCQENPSLPICGTSKFAGTCAAVACEGDAIQCAIAAEQARRGCELFDTATTLSNIGTTAADGVAQPAGHPGNSAATVALNLSGMIDQTPLFGGNGSCPSDVTVGAYTLRFSAMCPSLVILGAALKAFALLVAAFIVFRKGM